MYKIDQWMLFIEVINNLYGRCKAQLFIPSSSFVKYNDLPVKVFVRMIVTESIKCFIFNFHYF